MTLTAALFIASLSQGAAQDDCMTAQSKVIVTGTSARARLEAAQQSNDPAEMRSAVDEALLAVNALLAATEPCRAPSAAHGTHGAHGAHVAPSAPAAHDTHDAHRAHATPRPPAATPADPHAGHRAPAPRKTVTKPASATPDPHAGHQAAPSPSPAPAPRKLVVFADDPKKLVCPAAIDPETAPTTTYQGKAYYFCTSAERLRFITNPAAYLKEKDAGR